MAIVITFHLRYTYTHTCTCIRSIIIYFNVCEMLYALLLAVGLYYFFYLLNYCLVVPHLL